MKSRKHLKEGTVIESIFFSRYLGVNTEEKAVKDWSNNPSKQLESFSRVKAPAGPGGKIYDPDRFHGFIRDLFCVFLACERDRDDSSQDAEPENIKLRTTKSNRASFLQIDGKLH